MHKWFYLIDIVHNVTGLAECYENSRNVGSYCLWHNNKEIITPLTPIELNSTIFHLYASTMSQLPLVTQPMGHRHQLHYVFLSHQFSVTHSGD